MCYFVFYRNSSLYYFNVYSFFRIGLTIANYPKLTIVISIIIPLVFSIGMYRYKFNEDFAELLLPPSSRIFEDRAWVKANVPYEQRVIRIILKNDNVLTKESMLGVSTEWPRIIKSPSMSPFKYGNDCAMVLFVIKKRRTIDYLPRKKRWSSWSSGMINWIVVVWELISFCFV